MYKLVRAGEKTYYMNGPYNIGFYKLSENEVCLIDSGVNDHTVQKIDEILVSTGWIPKIIINTHFHADHAGGNRYFKKKYGTKILATKTGVNLLDDYKLGPMMIFGANAPKEMYNKYTMAPDCPAELLDENSIPEGLEVINLPGHAIEMIGIKTDDDVYFLADALVSEITLNIHQITFLFDVRKYLDSLDYIKTLKGKLFVPAHAPAEKDITKLAELNRQSVLKNIKLIVDICEEPKTTDEVIEAVFIHYDLKNGFYQYVVNGAIIKSYLSSLWDDGRLEVIEVGKKICWKKVHFDK